MRAVSRLEIRAGPHERVYCPVAVPEAEVDPRADAAPALAAARPQPAVAELKAVLRIGGEEHELPLQRAGDAPWCVLPYLGPDVVEGMEVRAGTPYRGKGVRIIDRGAHLEVTVEGMPWCEYHYAGNPVRSYLHPVIGPYGVPMTRAWPLQEGVAGEETDHVHHRSFWVAHGLVNGVDFWSEADGHGCQVHGGFEAVESGPAFGRIVQRVSWCRDDSGGTALLEERRILTFWNTPPTARILDLTLDLHAAHGDVTFGDTKEGGLCSLRVNEVIKGARGGVISNACGGIGEAETWGQRAPWADYSGELTDPSGLRRAIGVAIFDHPRNPHFPTHWHVRGYGLFSANPFGLADYGSGYRQCGDWTLAAGERATFRYRVLWHGGTAIGARVGARYLDWAVPPAVTSGERGD